MKKDYLLSIIIGEVAAWLIILIAKNLGAEIPAVGAIAPYLYYLPIVFPLVCAIGLGVASFLGRVMPVFYQLAKFVLVGGLNFLIDMGVLNFLVFYTGIASGAAQTGFKGLSFLVAVTNSYIWNKFWTFKRSSTESVGKEFFQFVVVSVIGLTINLAVDYVVVNFVSPFGGLPVKSWAQLGALVAAVVALTWNFVGYKFIVFDSKKD